MSRPRAVPTRPGPSLTPILASADDAMQSRPVSSGPAHSGVSWSQSWSQAPVRWLRLRAVGPIQIFCNQAGTWSSCTTKSSLVASGIDRCRTYPGHGHYGLSSCCQGEVSKVDGHRVARIRGVCLYGCPFIWGEANAYQRAALSAVGLPLAFGRGARRTPSLRVVTHSLNLLGKLFAISVSPYSNGNFHEP
jgi:hypothetical protein